MLIVIVYDLFEAEETVVIGGHTLEETVFAITDVAFVFDETVYFGSLFDADAVVGKHEDLTGLDFCKGFNCNFICDKNDASSSNI